MITFPATLDAFTNPLATDLENSVTVPHHGQHSDANDAIEALEAKVGVDGSIVTTSLDYKVASAGMSRVETPVVGYVASQGVVLSPPLLAGRSAQVRVWVGGFRWPTALLTIASGLVTITADLGVLLDGDNLIVEYPS